MRHPDTAWQLQNGRPASTRTYATCRELVDTIERLVEHDQAYVSTINQYYRFHEAQPRSGFTAKLRNQEGGWCVTSGGRLATLHLCYEHDDCLDNSWLAEECRIKRTGR